MTSGSHGNHAENEVWWTRALAAIRPHSHDHTGAIQTAEEASDTGIRAAWISLVGMAVITALQVGIVAVSGSIALLADVVHSIGHLVTTIPLIIAFRLGRRPPTRRYPFGFRRAEDLAGLFITLIIAVSAAVIVWESVDALVNPREMTNLGWVFAAAIVGMIGNETVAIYRIRAGRRIGSAALIAEGQHARTDGLVSLAVVLAVIGVWLGFPQADAVIGLLIAAAVLWILVSSSRMVMRRLMDGVEDGTVEAIEAVTAAVDGVEAVDGIRARWSGHRLQAELEIGVDGGLTVTHGHHIAEVVQHELLHAVRHLEHVAVHVNPTHAGVIPRGAHALTDHHTSRPGRH